MRRISKFIRMALATIGAFLVFSAISTCDYYTLELNQSEPGYIWVMLVVGFLMTLPAVLHAIFE